MADRALRLLYSLGWAAALPFLRRNARLAAGWGQRLLRAPLPAADLWVQAASVGEVRLLDELLPALAQAMNGHPLAVLATTNTDQGLEALNALAERLAGSPITLRPAYMPFDKPALAARALEQVRPRAVALLEGELWPGLLAACTDRGVPALLINGRMRPRSLARLLAISPFLRSVAPADILAVSEADARRLALLFEAGPGWGRVGRMSNIKFDRVRPGEELPYTRNPLRALVRPKTPLVVLASVREPEEAAVLEIVQGLLAARPRTVIGLFPRHLERVPAWVRRLRQAGVPAALRSAAQGPAAPGGVLVWDAFGELPAACWLARAAFVGGSLAPLGGQNFLEPLAAGVLPVIGPHYDNFSWAAEPLAAAGLLRMAPDASGALGALLDILARTPARDKVRAALDAAIGPLRGGAGQAAERLAKRLSMDYETSVSPPPATP